MPSMYGYFTGLEINNENDILVFLANALMDDHQNVYTKVDRISHDIDVSPDIDLLSMNNYSKRTTGYETKYINYSTKMDRYIYHPIYSGIGQAMMHYNYGARAPRYTSSPTMGTSISCTLYWDIP